VVERSDTTGQPTQLLRYPKGITVSSKASTEILPSKAGIPPGYGWGMIHTGGVAGAQPPANG